MIFLNIIKNLQEQNLVQNLSSKKIKILLGMHAQDKNRIKFLRSKLKYGKVIFQLEYHYYKKKYLVSTIFKPVLINQVPDDKDKYSVENIADYVSLKKDIWGFLFFFISIFFVLTYVYVNSYNYIYVDLGDDPRFLCFKSTISRVNSNYFEMILENDPIQDLIGNRDFFPNSDFLVFLSGCSKSEFTKEPDFFLNEFYSIMGFKN